MFLIIVAIFTSKICCSEWPQIYSCSNLSNRYCLIKPFTIIFPLALSIIAISNLNFSIDVLIVLVRYTESEMLELLFILSGTDHRAFLYFIFQYLEWIFEIFLWILLYELHLASASLWINKRLHCYFIFSSVG